VRQNLILACVSLLLAFAAMELGLRRAYPLPAPWLEPQTRHLQSPLLGWVLPPSSQSYTIDAPVDVNSHGLRDDEMPREKPVGELRLLCLGDSFTFALGVRFEDLWVQQLERGLAAEWAPRPVQAINAGVAGYNTRQELIYLLSEGFSWSPDVVVVGFYWNDLVGNDERLPDLEETPKVTKQAEDDYETAARGDDHLLPGWLRNPLRRSLVLYLGVTRAKQIASLLAPPTDRYAQVQKALLAGDTAFLEPYWRDTARRLREIAGAARAREIPVVLLAFPMENQVRREYPEMARVWGDALREAWGPTGLPLVDLEAAYREATAAGGPDDPWLPYDLHPNARGMAIAAEAVRAAIRERGLLR
jgi:lysophospholipase L1-like esterase